MTGVPLHARACRPGRLTGATRRRRRHHVVAHATGSLERHAMTTATPAIDKPRSVAPTAATRPAPRGHGDYRPDPDRWKALAVVLAAGFMTLLDASIVNVALPSIEQGLHTQPSALEWIVAGYALSLGLLLV